MNLGTGLYWAKNTPSTPEPSNVCDCGNPVAPSDWLCAVCRREVEATYSVEVDEPMRCLNCDCYGFRLGDGEYECRNCGNIWNIYEEDELPF